MVAGADSLDDMGLLRHGEDGKLFADCYVASTLGAFLRAFTFRHVRQLDAVATRFLTGLAAGTPVVSGSDGGVLVDVDDTAFDVHGTSRRSADAG